MLPTQYRSYVYTHIDPRTKDVKYVGAGSGGRAWACNYSPKNSSKGRYGNRSEEHHKWLSEIFDAGFTMGDIVKIVAQGISRVEALAIEKTEIERYGLHTLFNRPYGQSSLILSKDDLEIAHELRGRGLSYRVIGDKLNVSAMTAHRALTGRTEGYRT